MAITKEYFAFWCGLEDDDIICVDVQSLKEFRLQHSSYSFYDKAMYSTRQMKFAPVNTNLGNCLILCDDQQISIVGYNLKSNNFEHDGRCVSFDIDQGLGILLELFD